MSASSKSMRKLRAARLNQAVCGAALAAAGMFAGGRAFATDITWSRAAGNPGNFGDGTNWVGGAAPGAADSGFINNGGISTIGAAFNGTIINLGLGSAAAGTGSLTQTGGTLTSTGNATFGGATTGAGTFNISGGTINVTGGGTSGSIAFGGDGAGTVTISGGFIAGRYVALGLNAHGHGHVVQTGGTLAVSQKFVLAELKPPDFAATPTPSDYTMSGGAITVGGSMYVGAHGPATFALSGTGSINVVGAIQIGASGGDSDPPAGSGTFNMSSGTVNVSGSNAYFVVADHGDGTFNFSGGSMTTNVYSIGQNFEAGFSTKGVVNHSGGSATVLLSWVIGEQSQSANLYDLSGGTVTTIGAGETAPGDLNIASAQDSKGTLMVRGTGVANLANAVNVGNAGGTNGTLTVSGGTVALGLNGLGLGLLVVGIDGTGNVQVSGGNVSGDGMTLGQNAGGLGTGTQTGGTVVIRKDMSVGELSTLANVYEITGGTLSVGTAALGGIFVGSTGNGTLKVGGTASVTSASSITNALAGSGTIVVSGGTVVAPGLINNGTYSQSGGVATVGAVTGTGSASVSGGTLNTTSIAQSIFSVSGTGTATVAPDGTNAGLSVIGTLSVTGSGRLDLNNNDLIVRSGTYAAISTLIKNARNGGAWNQGGLTSTSAKNASPTNTTLGALTGVQFKSVYGNAAPFDGASVANSDVLVKYTYYGDTDFNGKVDGADYARIDASFNNQATQGNISGWFNGDLDYNNKVDGSDYALIDSAFNSQGGTLRPALSFLDGSDPNVDMLQNPALTLVLHHYEQFGQPYALAFINSVPEPASCIATASIVAGAALRRARQRNRIS